MHLSDFISEQCKDKNLASTINNISDAAIIISNEIKNSLNAKVDVVLSDLAVNTRGIKKIDEDNWSGTMCPYCGEY